MYLSENISVHCMHAGDRSPNLSSVTHTHPSPAHSLPEIPFQNPKAEPKTSFSFQLSTKSVSSSIRIDSFCILLVKFVLKNAPSVVSICLPRKLDNCFHFSSNFVLFLNRSTGFSVESSLKIIFAVCKTFSRHF